MFALIQSDWCLRRRENLNTQRDIRDAFAQKKKDHKRT